MRSLFACAFAAVAAAKTAAEWKQRSVYQLLTDRFGRTDGLTAKCTDLTKYCGGTFNGITQHLDYIQGMGFDAIWISPIPHNAEPDYHGYGALNWEQINEHFGTSDELHQLIAAAHSRDIWVMLDVVGNHSSYYAETDFSNVYPLNKAEYYHPYCANVSWTQWEIENCWAWGLPDLDQANPYVRSYLKSWIRNVVQSYDFDGIRIDTVQEVPKDFWAEYNQAAGVFQMGEVYNPDPAYVGGYQGPVTATFNYPMYFTIKDVFAYNQSMFNIRSMYDTENEYFSDVDALGSFVNNHDNPRFLSLTSNWAAFKSAITFAMTARGIPFFYYGDEQGFNGANDPYCRESLWNAMDTNADVYQYVAKINKARKAAQIWNYPYIERYVLDNFFAFSKGDMLVLTTNSLKEVNVQMPYLPYAAGTEVCNIFWPDVDCLTVTSAGMPAVLMNGEAKIFLPKTSAYFKQMSEELIQ